MKKHVYLFSILFFPILVFGQNVGVGTLSPEAKLTIQGTYSYPLIPGNNSNGILRIGPGSNNALDIGKKFGGTYDAWLQAGFNGNPNPISLQPLGGNVGIGVLSPNEKLEVNGGIKANSLDVSSGLIKNVADPVDAQDSATKAYVDDEISSLPSITTYAVGDFAHGGIVFWVDETGQHGLVCAKSDQSAKFRWYAGTNGGTRATGDGIYAGAANTTIIISSQIAIGDDGSDYAAQICNDLQITEGGTTYGDWYLPSKFELDLLYDNKAMIDVTALANGGAAFGTDYYWSSTEDDSSHAWRQYFGNAYQHDSVKYFECDVRAVRAF